MIQTMWLYFGAKSNQVQSRQAKSTGRWNPTTKIKEMRTLEVINRINHRTIQFRDNTINFENYPFNDFFINSLPLNNIIPAILQKIKMGNKYFFCVILFSWEVTRKVKFWKD